MLTWTRSVASPTTSATADLDSPLSSLLPLSQECQKQLLNLCWATPSQHGLEEWDHEHFALYFHHYHQYCYNVPEELKSCTHRHICQSVQQISQGKREFCEEALAKLLPMGSGRMLAKECIDFAGKAIMFIDLSQWQDHETVEQFLERRFAVNVKPATDFRMPRSFNARTFAKVAGINVQWSRELTRHLEVAGNDNVIAIFHSITALDLYEKSGMGTIFPPGFLEETRRTLSLVLPIADDKTKSWLKSEQRKTKLDPVIASCPHLPAAQRHIKNFPFWGDRLVIIKDVYDEHQPRGISQMWRDNRNQVQWWTFWIAIVVFLLTVTACVEGALQVYKAYHPSL